MKRLYIFVTFIATLGILSYSFYGGKGDNPPTPRTYVGSQTCLCHIPSGLFDNWSQTLHGKAQMTPGPGSVISPWNATTINMGSAYGNATVTLSIVGGIYKATLNPSSGTPVTYNVAQTRGSGWKQYYHTKINNSYYRLPVLWTNGHYKNPVGGSFSASGQGSWFTSSGALQPVNTNTFRKTSWDKGCSGCHTTGGKVTLTVTGTDSNWVNNWANGSDTMNAKVGCESCHGPGSDHIADPVASNIFGPTQMGAAGLQRQQEVCAQCHFRGTSTNNTYPWPLKESVDSMYQSGLPLVNYVKTPWQNYINQTGGPALWPDSMSARSDRTESQEFTFSAHYQNLKCFDCHDPHRVTSFGHQLRDNPDDNSLCFGCHTNFGTPGNPNIVAITSHTKHIYDPTNQYHTGGSSRCIKCHMTNVATNIKDYDIPSHSFKVIRPIQTLLKKGIVLGSNSGNLNACAAACHRNPLSAAGTTNVPGLGVGYDSNFTNWSERTDSLLADTLNKWFNNQNWQVIGISPVSNEVPEKFVLGQNYPNPFNPSTKINFSLPKTEFVSIRIYDIIGREVYKLVDEKLNTGTYSVDWNSINNFGNYVASGVYFYRITAGNYTETKKMILLR
jgi:predicted CXXCH cytochrome family protein